MEGKYVPTELTDAELGYVTELTDSDVLFGRGSGPNDHEGNVRFRQLVAARKSEYLATNHRLTKAKIAREIVDQVFAQKGRFLKKMEADDLCRMGLPEGTDAWVGVDDDTIMEKAKQALRQNTNKKNQNNPSSPVAVTSQPKPQQQQQHTLPTKDPSQQLPQYVLDDLEPIPLGTHSSSNHGPATRHAQRPSQLAMPPPAVASTATEWQMQQQRQQQHLVQQQRMAHPDTQYSSALAEHHPQLQHPGQYITTQGIATTNDPYLDRDNMMAYVPRGMMPQQQQQQQQQLHQPPPPPTTTSHQQPTFNNISISNLPTSDAPVRNSLRGSLNTFGDAAESMDMSQLMSSFQSAKISDEGGGGGRRHMASTETMGTIEQIPTAGDSSIADMSLGSSTFSILKGDDSALGLSSVTVPAMGTPTSQGTFTKTLSSGTATNSLMGASLGSGGRMGISDSSLSFEGLTGSNRSLAGSANSGVRGGTGRASLTSTNLEGVKEEGTDTEPLPVGMNTSLGASSLSMLRGMVMSTEDVLEQAKEEYQKQKQEAASQEQQP